MFLDDDDSVIVRAEGFRYYLITVALLMYFEWYTLTLIYGYLAVSLFVSEDEDLDEYAAGDVDADLYIMLEVFFTLRPFDEVDGLVLLDWQVEEFLEQTLDEPILPETFMVVDSYKQSMCNTSIRNQFMSTTSINTKVDELAQRLAYRKQTLIESKLTISPEFNVYLAQEASWLKKNAYVKYRTASVIRNEFIASSLIYRGLYPYSQFDYEMYMAGSEFFNTLFLENMLISEKPTASINYLIDYNIETEKTLEYIYENVLPDDIQLKNFLAGRVDDLFSTPDDDYDD